MIHRSAGWLFVALVAAACSAGDQGPVAGEEYARLKADNVVVGLEQFVTKDGIRQAVLRADTGFVFEETSRVELAKVHLTLFRATGE